MDRYLASIGLLQQLLIYPFLALRSDNTRSRWHLGYRLIFTGVLGIPMAARLAQLLMHPVDRVRWGLEIVVWIVTLVQLPLHQQIAKHPVNPMWQIWGWNWVRVVAWGGAALY